MARTKRGVSIGIYFEVKQMPKEICDPRKLDRELRNALTKAAKDIRDDFELTTRTFRERPAFKTWGPIVTGNVMMVRVSTDSSKYRYLDEGAEPHVIRPRKAKMLYFQWGGRGSYHAKTRSGVIGSTSGGPSGSMQLRKMVHHPGIEARYFAFNIAKRRGQGIEQGIEQATYRAVAQTLGQGGGVA